MALIWANKKWPVLLTNRKGRKETMGPLPWPMVSRQWRAEAASLMSQVKSSPKAPLIWRSMNPGAKKKLKHLLKQKKYKLGAHELTNNVSIAVYFSVPPFSKEKIRKQYNFPMKEHGVANFLGAKIIYFYFNVL